MCPSGWQAPMGRGLGRDQHQAVGGGHCGRPRLSTDCFLTSREFVSGLQPEVSVQGLAIPSRVRWPKLSGCFFLFCGSPFEPFVLPF
jgi:hypothetical protein